MPPVSTAERSSAAPRYRALSIDEALARPELRRLPEELRHGMRIVARVLPFRVSEHALEHLVDWSQAPDDALFRLLFPRRELLPREDFDALEALLASDPRPEQVEQHVADLRRRLNPDPSAQLELNRPLIAGAPASGLQHKYSSTLLYFPAAGQTCHAYCSFCFRWPQFVGEPALKQSEPDASRLYRYLLEHREISDLLVTGGDPLVMGAERLEALLLPLLGNEFEHVKHLRLGTKALSFWPRRFVTDPDAERLLALFARLVSAGKHLALMMHVDHPRELEHPLTLEAIRRLRATGAVLRQQAPLLQGINADAAILRQLWERSTHLGLVPYYLFMARDTGAHAGFKVTLEQALELYRQAFSESTGLARTVRGPVMSATPGKVELLDILGTGSDQRFVLRFLQARDPAWVGRLFEARFDPQATWFDQLKPHGSPWWFEAPMQALHAAARH